LYVDNNPGVLFLEEEVQRADMRPVLDSSHRPPFSYLGINVKAPTAIGGKLFWIRNEVNLMSLFANFPVCSHFKRAALYVIFQEGSRKLSVHPRHRRTS
jgi:hypothetical protein